ncbi:hypothetical protein M011DRAFT_462663 [Sporormia fimetaria CBS 119925]|uniref:Protein kinase domain-containing protein n=1 Tax=Sporormia fimetaria CBS 119925 TaxID=1340428 RepID=A0A6A6UXJ5_9PLEO|nr:hypothetical protein M011DRAFT_462663 [Sporormia fimetaria CBS 119925]
MGSFFSRSMQPLKDPEKLSQGYLDNLTHGTLERYADFWEKAYGETHPDGQHIIIDVGQDHYGGFAREPIDWPLKKLRKMYGRLGEDECKRIVRFAGIHLDGLILVERLGVAPLRYLTLPTLEVQQKEDITIAAHSEETNFLLALYYRWALQALSELRFLHSHGVYIKFMSSQNVWLRSDYSLAITGFISAIVEGDPDKEEDYGEGGWVGDEYIECDLIDERNAASTGSFQEDLFFWAVFVWRLMTHEHSNEANWEPQSLDEPYDCVDPVQGEGLESRMSPCDISYLPAEFQQRRLYQQLDERRLGDILVKSWTGSYKNIDEAIEDIQQIARGQGLAVEGDEVGIGKTWEDVFEVVRTGELY